MIGNVVLKPKNEYLAMNKSKSQIANIGSNTYLKNKAKNTEEQSLKLMSQPDPLNWQSRQYIDHMK